MLNDELKLKVFFEGEGFVKGKRDCEVFEQLKEKNID